MAKKRNHAVSGRLSRGLVGKTSRRVRPRDQKRAVVREKLRESPVPGSEAEAATTITIPRGMTAYSAAVTPCRFDSRGLTGR